MPAYLIIPFTCVLIFAAIIDLRVQKIPNLLTYPSMILAITYYAFMEGVTGLLFSAGGMILGVVVFFVFYAMGGMGAGDVKLVGVAGAVLGPKGVLIASVLIALTGGLYALMLLILKRQWAKGFIGRYLLTLKTFIWTRQFIPIPAPSEEKQPKLCYGVAIALGTLVYVFMKTNGYKFTI